MSFYKLAPDHVIVVSDEVALPIGKLRIRTKGSAGGHNGLKNIIALLGTDQFPRIRIGVGAAPHPDYDMADWVLSSFKGKDALLNYYTSPMYVPSVAFAFVLLQVYSQIGGVSGMLRIFIGHLIIILPYIVRNTVSVLHVFNWTLEDAATSMGATPIQVFFKITIPLARTGIMAGALLAFLYSFDEVALSSLLSTPRFITLPIRIMNYMELTFDPTLAAISTLLILASLVLIVLMEKFVGLDMFVK